MKEEEKILGPILGNRWTVKREPLQGTSKCAACFVAAALAAAAVGAAAGASLACESVDGVCHCVLLFVKFPTPKYL